MNRAEDGFENDLSAHLDRLAGFAPVGPDADRVLAALQRRGRQRAAAAGTASLLVVLTSVWLWVRSPADLAKPLNIHASPPALLANRPVPSLLPAIPSWRMKIPARSVRVANIAIALKVVAFSRPSTVIQKTPDTSLRLSVPLVTFSTICW